MKRTMKKSVLGCMIALLLVMSSLQLPVSAVEQPLELISVMEADAVDEAADLQPDNEAAGENAADIGEANEGQAEVETEEENEAGSAEETVETENEGGQNRIEENSGETAKEASGGEQSQVEDSSNEQGEETESAVPEKRLEEMEDSMQEDAFLFLSEPDAENLTADTEAAQALIEEIESGEMIAVAPLAEAAELAVEEEAEAMTVDSNEATTYTSARLAVDQYKIYVSPTLAHCDEVWTEDSEFHARLRYIEYVDSEGATKRSPLYCLKASKNGIDYSDPSGDVIKDAAISFLSNSTIKKLLYFGYKGPGDICDDYDPTCSHIDWSNWENRYVFTHQALSKVYANDIGGATAAQAKHVGLDAFIDYIKALTIPSRTAVKIKTTNSSGDIVTLNPSDIYLQLYRTKPETGFDYLDASFDKGFQMSNLCTVSDGGNAKANGVTFSCGSDADWQMHYWTSAAAYQSNPDSPKVLGKGKSVQLKHGYVFRVVFPENISNTRTFAFKMNQRPIKFVAVDGNLQMSGSGYQDFGAYVYQGTRGIVTMNYIPQSMGEILLTKICAKSGEPVPGAVYQLYAGEDLYNGGVLFQTKDTLITQGTTDASGQISFSALLPGTYYLKESKAASGYLLDTGIYNYTVQANKTTAANVQDIPDITGSVSIKKVIKDTQLTLAGAEFTLYSWNQTNNAYEKHSVLTYDTSTKLYVSSKVAYDMTNRGKFLVRETKNPTGFSGSWEAEFLLTETGTYKIFSYEVENEPAEDMLVEIRKTDKETGETLEGAEFTIYEYSAALGNFKEVGAILLYDADAQVYKSDTLVFSEDNLGRFKVVETKNPEGYTGTWEQEIDLNMEDHVLQYNVENTPIPRSYGTVKIVKKDVYTGEDLEGAEFTVWQWNEEQLAYEDILEGMRLLSYDRKKSAYVSGQLEITSMNKGKFLIKETKNPDGYTGSWEKEIILETDGAEVVCEVENEPIRLPCGEIVVYKKIQEADIIWAHGDPTFTFVAEGTDVRGNSHKYEGFVTYVQDSYETDEEGYAILKLTFSDVPIGTYQVYEKPVLRYYLKEMRALTGNVQIINGITPSYGADPKDIGYGNVTLDVANRSASLLFLNEKSRYDGYSHNSIVQNTIPLISGDKEER